MTDASNTSDSARPGAPESGASAGEAHRPAAFLDRDGIINVDVGFLVSPDQFRFMPGMPAAIKALNDAGWLVIVVTNQSGIGRGYYTEDDFQAFTAWIDEQLAKAGAHVDAWYHCAHHPIAGFGDYLQECECRKPRPGMLQRAMREWRPDVERSFMLGDSERDMIAATAAGVRGVFYDGGDLLAVVSGLIEDDRRRVSAAAPGGEDS